MKLLASTGWKTGSQPSRPGNPWPKFVALGSGTQSVTKLHACTSWPFTQLYRTSYQSMVFQVLGPQAAPLVQAPTGLQELYAPDVMTMKLSFPSVMGACSCTVKAGS